MSWISLCACLVAMSKFPNSQILFLIFNFIFILFRYLKEMYAYVSLWLGWGGLSCAGRWVSGTNVSALVISFFFSGSTAGDISTQGRGWYFDDTTETPMWRQCFRKVLLEWPWWFWDIISFIAPGLKNISKVYWLSIFTDPDTSCKV